MPSQQGLVFALTNYGISVSVLAIRPVIQGRINASTEGEPILEKVKSKIPEYIRLLLSIPEEREIDPRRDIGGPQMTSMSPLAQAVRNRSLHSEKCG